jgi:DNA-binding FadR family transcriptional regulator
MVKSLRRDALVDLATQQLSSQLQSGTWPVGTALPGELKLAEALGVGRSTIREALSALARQGLVEARQGSGTYVLALTATAPLNVVLNTAAIIEVYEVREALEVRAAILAATRRTHDDISDLRATMAGRDELISSQSTAPAAFVHADLRFHRAVVAAAHNDLLLSLYDSFAAVIVDTLTTVIATNALGDVDVEATHSALLDAIIAGDPVAAEVAVKANVDLTIATVSPHGPVD